MSERYISVYALPERLYAEDSPVLLEAGALLADGQTGETLALFRLRDLSRKPIRATRLRFAAFNAFGEELPEPPEAVFLDLDAGWNETFGDTLPVTMPDPATRSVKLRSVTVSFADGMVWDRTGSWAPLAPALPLEDWLRDDELLRQYRLKYGTDLVCPAAEENGQWLCGCGCRSRVSEGTVCPGCGRSLADQREVDLVHLQAERDQRLEREQLAAEQFRLRAERTAAREQAVRRRGLRIGAVALAAAAVVGLGVWLTTGVIRPARVYRAAAALLDQGDYAAAAEAFDSLGDYRDSARQALVARAEGAREEARLAEIYARAEKQLAENDLPGARETFGSLGEYRDSTGRAEEIGELLYARAEEQLAADDLPGAREIFDSLGDYRDSADRVWSIDETVYTRAREFLSPEEPAENAAAGESETAPADTP